MEDAVLPNLAILGESQLTGNHKCKFETGARTASRKEMAHLKHMNNRTGRCVPEMSFNGLVIDQVFFFFLYQ